MAQLNLRSRRQSAGSFGVLAAFFFYVCLVGAAVAVLPLYIAALLGILPLSALLFNQSLTFKAPLRLLHWSFVAAMVLFILWPRYLAFNFGGPDLTPARLAYVVLLGIWAGALISPEFRRSLWGTFHLERRWILLIGAYIILRLVSCFFSDGVGLSFYQTANELFTALLLVPIILSIYRDRSRLESLIFWIFSAALLVACLAIIERIVSHTLFAGVTIPGMNIDSVWLQQAITDKVREGRYRAQSTFSHPLLLAEFMVFAIPLSFYFISRKGFWTTFVGVVGLLLFVAGAVLSGSRSSLVAIPPMVVMAIVLFSFRSQGSGRLSVSAIIMLLTLAMLGLCAFTLLASGEIDLRVITGRSTLEIASTNTRLQMISRGIPLIAERPLVGYGPGLAGYILGIANAAGTITIDNYYLSLALESGVPTLLIFLILFFGVSGKGYLCAMSLRTDSGLLKGLLSISLVGMLIVKSILSIPHNLPLLVLCVAIILLPAQSDVAHLERAR
jgi:hypothetical protein